VTFPQAELLESVYNATGITPLYLFVGLGIVTGALLIHTFGFGAFGRCFSFTYLVYVTFKVKEVHNENIVTADKIHWLSHWAFYGTWVFFDNVTGFFFYWIPYIDALKIMFLIWCLLPQTRGAQQVYYLIIHRGFQRYEKEIDRYLDSMWASMSRVRTSTFARSFSRSPDSTCGTCHGGGHASRVTHGHKHTRALHIGNDRDRTTGSGVRHGAAGIDGHQFVPIGMGLPC